MVIRVEDICLLALVVGIDNSSAVESGAVIIAALCHCSFYLKTLKSTKTTFEVRCGYFNIRKKRKTIVA
jgi:hypothetical protein